MTERAFVEASVELFYRTFGQRHAHPFESMPTTGSEHGWPEHRTPLLERFHAAEREGSTTARIVSVEHFTTEAR